MLNLVLFQGVEIIIFFCFYNLSFDYTVMISIYNYFFGYGEVKCCNCGLKMTVKNPNPNELYSCSNGCTFEAYNHMKKNEN